jgi:hypothetical protein
MLYHAPPASICTATHNLKKFSVRFTPCSTFAHWHWYLHLLSGLYSTFHLNPQNIESPV